MRAISLHVLSLIVYKTDLVVWAAMFAILKQSRYLCNYRTVGVSAVPSVHRMLLCANLQAAIPWQRSLEPSQVQD